MAEDIHDAGHSWWRKFIEENIHIRVYSLHRTTWKNTFFLDANIDVSSWGYYISLKLR
jgi:hypothetical protein